jgi:hypothetical protein
MPNMRSRSSVTWSAASGVVAVGVVVQQLAEAQGGACDDRQAQLGVADAEPSGVDGGIDVATRAWREPRSEPTRARPLCSNTTASSPGRGARDAVD